MTKDSEKNPEGNNLIVMKSNKLIPYHLHSGGASGSDYYWGSVGMKLGLVNVHHYYVEGFKTPFK